MSVTTSACKSVSIRFALEGKLAVDDREIPHQLSTTVGASRKVNMNCFLTAL